MSSKNALTSPEKYPWQYSTVRGLSENHTVSCLVYVLIRNWKWWLSSSGRILNLRFARDNSSCQYCFDCVLDYLAFAVYVLCVCTEFKKQISPSLSPTGVNSKATNLTSHFWNMIMPIFVSMSINTQVFIAVIIWIFFPDVEHLHWAQTLKDVHMAINANLQWECRAIGQPPPTYRWMKNGQPLAAEVRLTK